MEEKRQGKLRLDSGIEIAYEELGSGDKYVLCTQVGHAKYEMERFLPRYGFHVFLLTNRGFGRSTHVTEDYGEHWYDVFADDAVAFADKMGIDRFVYSGASHGAGAGWHLMLNHPERVICFFASVAGPHNIDEGKMSMRKQSMNGELKISFEGETDDEAILERRRLNREADEMLRREPDYERIYDSPETRAIDYGRPLVKYGTEAEVCKALSTIKVPTLLLCGTEDMIARPDLMLRTVKCLPNCKLVMYSGAGHSMDIFEEMAFEANEFYKNVTETGRVYKKVVNDL